MARHNQTTRKAGRSGKPGRPFPYPNGALIYHNGFAAVVSCAPAEGVLHLSVQYQGFTPRTSRKTGSGKRHDWMPLAAFHFDDRRRNRWLYSIHMFKLSAGAKESRRSPPLRTVPGKPSKASMTE